MLMYTAQTVEAVPHVDPNLNRNGRPRRPSLLCLALILIFAGIFDIAVAHTMSPTGDEGDFLDYGERILHAKPDRSGHLMWNSKTPITAANALPFALAAVLQHHHLFPVIVAELRTHLLARLASVFNLVLLDAFIFYWGYELYGLGGAF